MSGGNRDVMLNGWLALGGGRRFIVEVQLHLRVLFELKSDLHVLCAHANATTRTASHPPLSEPSLPTLGENRRCPHLVRTVVAFS